jgi:hypothetical protein
MLFLVLEGEYQIERGSERGRIVKSISDCKKLYGSVV